MCWTTKTPPVKHIAKEIIYVYKVIYNIDEFQCSSLIMGFTYERYKLYTQNEALMLLRKMYNQWKIEKGFHSYGTYLRAQEELNKYFFCPAELNIKIVRCLIPEGSIFYKNENNEIVSDKIIVVDF